MKCENHPKKNSSGACVECGKLFCDDCIIKVGRKRYCKECASEILEDSDDDTITHKYKDKNIVVTQQTTNHIPDETVIKHTVDNETASKVGRWIVSIFFGILAFSYLIDFNPLTIFMIILFLMWLPPFENWLKEEHKIILPLWVKIASIVIACMLIGVFA
ncbi:hypothetical protein HOK51_09445 [Candidatus Woesearchaeota archaeon]|jgi:hypothetical protein|nr:hypothetical protein [Candidatus Woesearchaeota archaeon]MBT7368436.1 hypothetical protein [Candidatus Woesearchaeota archaeon]